MIVYEFTLRLALPDKSSDPGEYAETLGVTGCDDALIGIGVAGRIALAFSREAASAYKAFSSAISDVTKAVPEARLIEVGPDLVGLTDVAEIMGFSRQYMRKLMLAKGTAFPLPVHEGKATIWHLVQILEWLRLCQGYDVDPMLLEVANVAMQFNLVKESRNLEAGAGEKIRTLFG